MSRRRVKPTEQREAERLARKDARRTARRQALAQLSKYVSERDAVRRAREVDRVVAQMRADADARPADHRNHRAAPMGAVDGDGAAAENPPAGESH